jgi:hypothetical protein
MIRLFKHYIPHAVLLLGLIDLALLMMAGISPGGCGPNNWAWPAGRSMTASGRWRCSR